MTLATATPRGIAIGNGTRGPFTMQDSDGNPVYFGSNGAVSLRRYSSVTDESGTALVYGTDFTLTGIPGTGVTFTLTSLQAVLASTERILWKRVQNISQTLALSTGGDFSSAAIMARLDQHAQYLQDLRRDVDRKPELDWRETSQRALPIAPASATVAIGRQTDGSFVNLTPASFNSDVFLGSGWADALADDVDEILDDAKGIRICATYAEMTALTADELTAGAVVYTRSRSTEGDGGHGQWRVVAGTSTDNGGTVKNHDSLSFYFRRLYNELAFIEWFGGVNDGATTNTAAYNAWLTAATAGTAPKTLRFGNGTYLFLTKPDKIQTPGINIEGSAYTTVKMGFSGADRTEALFHFYGDAAFGRVRDMAIGTHDNGSFGGSLIRLEATSSNAPSDCKLEGLYLTSYATVSALTISAVSNAGEGVFTSAGHGYSAGQHVVLSSLAGGTFDTLNEKRYTIAPSPATDTFKLYAYGTTNYVDTTSLGTYTGNSGTVKRALCADAPISIDGTAKSTGAAGVRVTDIMHCTIFGGGEATIYASGYRALSIHGGNISSSGWVGRPYLTGSAGVEGQNAILSALSFPGLYLDRADETNFRSANNTGTITTTGNTGDIYRQILLDNTTSNQGVVVPAGTQDITVTKAAPVISMVESDNSNVISRLRAVAGALNIEVDPTTLASGSVIYLIADGTTTWQTGAGEHFTSVPICPLTDDAIDLGTGSFRFDDIYATNTTIQSSDENIKQDVQPLSDAELRAGRKIAKLIRTYRMIASVEEKGDDARIHTGLIAQRVAEALESEGLDPWRYAFMCRNTIEWDDPLAQRRTAIAEAENRIPETEAELERMLIARDAEIARANADSRPGLAKEWAAIIDNLQKRLDADRMTAQATLPPAPAWFEPYERWSLRYGEIWPWMIAAQEQRLEMLENGVIP